jgi:GNAT superfamily N-acetyltransferase
MISDGYTDLPPGRLAAVVTYLEMCERPDGGDLPSPPGVDVRRVETPDPDWYLNLFRAVGQDWLWFSRLTWRRDELTQVLQDPCVSIYVLTQYGVDGGLLELDARCMPDVEIAMFGLTADLTGRGIGRYFMQRALDFAWELGPERVILHTCTLDHPRALEFYLRSGFRAYKRAIEVAPDPRLTGALPRTAGRFVPIID